MPRTEKTVFICYRRFNVSWALFIYQYLTNHGYDVFFDYLSINSGDFEKVIIENIKARAHFLVILTPSALDHCGESGDWMRRELEIALDEKRNIVPLMVESFDFGSPSVKKALTGRLACLSKLNGLRIPSDYAFEAMDRLRMRYLAVGLQDVKLPELQESVKEITQNQKEAADMAEPVKEQQLTAQDWFERAYVFEQQENYDEALRCYNECLKLETISQNLSGINNNIGNVYLFQEDYEKAFSAFQKAIKLNPKFAYPYNGLGILFNLQGKHEEAIEAYKKAIRLDSKFVNPWDGLGIVYNEQGKTEEALIAYQKAISLAPEFADTWNGLGYVYYKLGKLAEAIAAYKKALELDPGFVSPWNGLGIVYRCQGKQDKAIAAYHKAIELDPNNASIWNGLGIVYRQMGRVKEALQAFQKAIDLDPDEGSIFSSLAVCYFLLGEHEEYQKYLKLARTNISDEDLYSQACFYAICNEFDLSLEFLQKSINEKPELKIWARKDPDFAPIRDDPRYREIVGLN